MQVCNHKPIPTQSAVQTLSPTSLTHSHTHDALPAVPAEPGRAAEGAEAVTNSAGVRDGCSGVIGLLDLQPAQPRGPNTAAWSQSHSLPVTTATSCNTCSPSVDTEKLETQADSNTLDDSEEPWLLTNI